MGFRVVFEGSGIAHPMGWVASGTPWSFHHEGYRLVVVYELQRRYLERIGQVMTECGRGWPIPTAVEQLQ